MVRIMRGPLGTSLPLLLAGALVATGCGASSAAHIASKTGTHIASSRPVSDTSTHVYKVLTTSMEPTLTIRGTVAIKEGTPVVGAIVVAHQPEVRFGHECGPKPHTIKSGGAPGDAPVAQESKLNVVTRVVAGPGDEIYIRGGHVYRKASGSRKFVREHDPYIRGCGSRPGRTFPYSGGIPKRPWLL